MRSDIIAWRKRGSVIASWPSGLTATSGQDHRGDDGAGGDLAFLKKIGATRMMPTVTSCWNLYCVAVVRPARETLLICSLVAELLMVRSRQRFEQDALRPQAFHRLGGVDGLNQHGLAQGGLVGRGGHAPADQGSGRPGR